MNLSDYDNKKIKVYLKDGSTFEGFSVHNSREYSYCEFGINAECLQMCEYLIRDEEIERVEFIDSFPSIRSTEEEMAMIFSVKRAFSEHLKRWEDNELPDKYDHNCFEYSQQPTQEEYERALNEQRERGDTFIKLVGSYYFYSSNGFTCLDGLIVDEDYRGRYIATTLLKHAVDEAAGNVVFLHADKDDTPKEMYEKLGFREVDRFYEYLSTDINSLH